MNPTDQTIGRGRNLVLDPVSLGPPLRRLLRQVRNRVLGGGGETDDSPLRCVPLTLPRREW